MRTLLALAFALVAAAPLAFSQETPSEAPRAGDETVWRGVPGTAWNPIPLESGMTVVTGPDEYEARIDELETENDRLKFNLWQYRVVLQTVYILESDQRVQAFIKTILDILPRVNLREE